MDSLLLVLDGFVSLLDLTTQTFNVTFQGCNDGIPLSELILQALDLRPIVTNLFLRTVRLHTYVHTQKIHDGHSVNEYEGSTIIVDITFEDSQKKHTKSITLITFCGFTNFLKC